MILHQFYLNCLAHASYLVGDERSGDAVVVDPQRDVDQYLTFADKHRLRIRHVVLTHLHADFVAGHLELRDRAGATIYLGAKAKAQYKFKPMADGDALDVGKVRLKILETPGHTPESISIVVYDLAISPDKPQAVLTGMLASFAIYAGAVIWVFAVRSELKAWVGLLIVALPLLPLAWSVY